MFSRWNKGRRVLQICFDLFVWSYVFFVRSKKHASNQTLCCHVKMAQLVAKEPLEDNRSLSNLPWCFSFEYREGGREGGTGV